MRISDNNRLTRAGSGKSKKPEKSGGEKFSISGEAQQMRGSDASAPVHDVGGIDALLALQAVHDPLSDRKKAVRYGHDLLDGLEQMRIDLLNGNLSGERLEIMLDRVNRARQKNGSKLDAVIDEIELRVGVELAKLGKFREF